MRFFDCTADLVGQLNGMDRKECYRLTHPLSKISGYVLWFLILKSRYVALDSVDNSNDCKKWLVDLTIVSVWYSSVVLL